MSQLWSGGPGLSGRKRPTLPKAYGGASTKAALLNHPLIRSLVEPEDLLEMPVELGRCPPP